MTNSNDVRFEVLRMASMKMAVFWVCAPRSLVEIYCHIGGTCCFHHQGDEPDCPDTTIQKTAIFDNDVFRSTIDEVMAYFKVLICKVTYKHMC
jgi:hypothetical protein